MMTIKEAKRVLYEIIGQSIENKASDTCSKETLEIYTDNVMGLYNNFEENMTYYKLSCEEYLYFAIDEMNKY